MARRFPARAGKVCEEHRVVLPPQPTGNSPILSITLQKVDTDVYVGVLIDAVRVRSVRDLPDTR
jgi:hypothetical protein